MACEDTNGNSGVARHEIFREPDAPQWRTMSGKLYDEQDLQPSPTVLLKFKKGSEIPASSWFARIEKNGDDINTDGGIGTRETREGIQSNNSSVYNKYAA